MTESTPSTVANKSGYADANGLKLYYEMSGSGEPLVVLHGAYMTLSMMGDLIPKLAETHQVIAFELQGHGHTADVDRPLTFEGMADDVAAAMQSLNLGKVDVFGYSMGATTALALAIRHPEQVNRLIVVSGTYSTEGIYPEMLAMVDFITPELMADTPPATEYKKVAPNPDAFPTLVTKLVALTKAPQDWSAESVQAISAPTLIIVGDSDQVTLDHTVSLFRLRGGGVPGDMVGLPAAQLAVIPGATHSSVADMVDLLAPIVNRFLATPPTSTP